MADAIHLEGVVTKFRPEKGHGLIHGDDGHEYWAHFMYIVGERYPKLLDAGERVAFVWTGRMQDARRTAEQIVRLDHIRAGGESIHPTAYKTIDIQ